MAQNLGVSPAFLSAVESGKKSIPAEMQKSVERLYALPQVKILEMRKAVDESQRSVTIDLDKMDHMARGVAVAFARQFDQLNQAELEALKKTMDAVRNRVKDE
jgi:DNA-binding transcriptional regulator YdaS (Cro superfamily)